MTSLQLLLLLLLHSLHPSVNFVYGVEDDGSGCEDQETAALCMEGSGSSAGSGDVSLEVTIESSARTVCRNSRLVTWVQDSGMADQSSYAMVQDCSRVKPLNQDVVSRCELEHLQMNMDEMSLLLPVTSSSSNVTYFNRYCFLCSDDVGPAVTWSVNVSCTQWVDLHSIGSERAVLRTALESGLCFMNLHPPTDLPTTKCGERLPLNTDVSSERVGPLDVSVSTQSRPPISLLLCFRGTERGGGHKGDGEKNEETGHNGSNASGDSSCSGVVVHRQSEKLCMDVNCAPGKRLENNTCLPVITRSRGLKYSLTLLVDIFVSTGDVTENGTSSDLSSMCSAEELAEAGVTQHASDLHTDSFYLTTWVLSARIDVPVTPLNDVSNDSEDDLYFLDPASASEQDTLLDDVDTTDEEFLFGQVLIWFDFFVTSDANRNDVEKEALRVSSVDWYVECGNTHARMVPVLKHRDDIVQEITSRDNITSEFPQVFTKIVNQFDHSVVSAESSEPVVISPLLMCPYLIFPREDFEIGKHASKDPVNTVTLTLMNVTQQVSDSHINTDSEGNLKICGSVIEKHYGKLIRGIGGSSQEDDHGEMSTWVLVEHYLCLVCVCLSLVCLLLTIVTYALFRSLRTIPGQNTVALCSNLFIAQALLQFGVNWTQLEGGCIALGILIHYFWLSSILWMNVCSFHMRKVFTSHRAARLCSSHVQCCGRRVLAYAVYAQGVPLVVIGATVSITILVSEGSQIGYGGNVCYLSSPILVGAAFAAPLGFTLLLNLFFFLGAMQAITRTETPVQMGHQNGHRSPSPDLQLTSLFPSTWRRNLNVCIRLSSLTGLFWTLGILAELLDVSALRLLSVVVNGSQGVLIALSYLPTRRVLRLYSQLCCTCRDGKRLSATISVPGLCPASSVATVSSSVLTVARDMNGHLHSSEI